jgi:hypothetical protein
MDQSSPFESDAAEPVESTFAWVFDWLLLSLGIFVVLIVIARLLISLPAYRQLRTPRDFADAMRKRGWWLTASAAVVMGFVYRILRSTEDAGLSASAFFVGLLGLGLGVYGTIVLSAGFAMSPRVDAKVLTPDGQDNAAWAIDVLTQIRVAHRAGAVPGATRPTTNHADFGTLINVADRSGYGMAALLGSVVQLLLNTSPWLVDVTVLNGATAAATLRRNGHDLEEVMLRLPYGDPSDDNHGELLIMASSFAAIGVAARYTDIKGFYEVENWRSAALVAVAMATSGEERRLCISQALEEDPSNLVAEYEEVADEYDDEGDTTNLVERMDRLEPMINLAALFCGTEPMLRTTSGQWHLVAIERHDARFERLRDSTPSRLLKILSVTRRERADLRAPDIPEPPLMMLRLMHWYLQSARNWLALGLERDGRLPNADDDPDTDVGSRRYRVGLVLGWMVVALNDPYVVERVNDPAELERMRMIGAVDAAILQEWVDQPFDEPMSNRLETWLQSAHNSTDSYVQHQIACYFAQQLHESAGDQDTQTWSARLFDAVRYAHSDPYWASWTFSDPELRLAGNDQKLRELALPDVAGPWHIERFAQIAGRTPVRAIADPAMLTDEMFAELALAPDLPPDVIRSISDGAMILRAARAASSSFDDRAVLRAVRYLLDDNGHDLKSLRLERTRDIHPIVDGVAAAVFWVPDPMERAIAAEFVMELLRRISVPSVPNPAA